MLAYARRRRGRLALAGSLGLFAAIGIALLAPNELLRGALFGAVLTWWSCALWFLVVQATGGAAPRLMGADGESWTAEAVRPLRRDGWRLVNDVFLTAGNIDHVLVGPAGIVVLESKWSFSPWGDDHGRAVVSAAADRLQKQAWRLAGGRTSTGSVDRRSCRPSSCGERVSTPYPHAPWSTRRTSCEVRTSEPGSPASHDRCSTARRWTPCTRQWPRDAERATST
jgi:hypothetical protein